MDMPLLQTTIESIQRNQVGHCRAYSASELLWVYTWYDLGTRWAPAGTRPSPPHPPGPPPPHTHICFHLAPRPQERFWQMLRREMQQFDEVQGCRGGRGLCMCLEGRVVARLRCATLVEPPWLPL